MQLFYNCLHNKVYHPWRLDYSASESSSEDNDGEKLKNDLPPSLSKYKGNTFLIRIPFKKYPTFTKQKEILKNNFTVNILHGQKRTLFEATLRESEHWKRTERSATIKRTFQNGIENRGKSS